VQITVIIHGGTQAGKYTYKIMQNQLMFLCSCMSGHCLKEHDTLQDRTGRHLLSRVGPYRDDLGPGDGNRRGEYPTRIESPKREALQAP